MAKRAALGVRAWFDLLLIGVAHGFSDSFASLVVPVMALIVEDLRLSDLQAGTLLSSLSLAAFLFVFPTSLAADRSGRKLQVLVAGLAIASLAYFSMLAASVFGVLLVCAFAAGAGNSVYHPCATALTAERFASVKPYAISAHGMMGNIGASVIPVLQAFIASRAGWRWSVAACTFPVVVIAPLLWLRYRGVNADSHRTERGSAAPRSSLAIAADVLRNRNVLLLATIYAMSGMASKSSVGFLALLLTRRFGFGVATVGLLMSMYYGTGIAAKPLMGYLYAKLGARVALGIPLLVSGAATLAIGFAPSPAVLVPLVALVGAANPISPVILTAAADLADSRILASSVGLIYSLHGAGFVGPLIGGWLAQMLGLPAAYAFASSLFIAGWLMSTLVAGLVAHPGRRSAEGSI